MLQECCRGVWSDRSSSARRHTSSAHREQQSMFGQQSMSWAPSRQLVPRPPRLRQLVPAGGSSSRAAAAAVATHPATHPRDSQQ